MLDLIAASRHDWSSLVESHGHLLQTWKWGDFQSRRRVCPERWLLVHVTGGRSTVIGGLQILWRTMPGGWRLGYVPKGPTFLTPPTPELWSDLSRAIRKRFPDPRALALRIEPNYPTTPDGERALGLSGYRRAPRDVQPRHTVLVDLTRPEPEVLASMQAKTRYNIRLAARRAVVVRVGTSTIDVDRFLQLHDETVIRDRYAAHPGSYLRRFLSTFSVESILLVASVDGEDVAGVVIAFHEAEAIYLYGASGNRYRNAMPNHALQWDAMLRSKARGCTSYDMWGISPPGSTDDAMAGLYRFKHGFGRVESWLGSWDLPLSPLYPLWRSLEAWRLQRRRANRAQ